MKVAIREFRTHREMDAYVTENIVFPVRPHLPMLLEVLEVDTSDETLIRNNLKYMARWYYYGFIRGKNPDSHAPNE